MARICEMSLDAWDPRKAEELHMSVGYFINSEGFMDWDLLRTMDKTCVSASAATGASVDAPEDVGSSRSGWRRAQDELSLKKAETEVAAAMKAVAIVEAPPVSNPINVVPRSRPKSSKNEYGCCITTGDHLKELEAVRLDEEKKLNDKETRTRNFWESWRSKVRAAEADLAAQGTPSKLKVGNMKAVIVSRTGHLPKAKTNLSPLKPMLLETRAAIESGSMSICPPTPPPASSPASLTDDEMNDEDDSSGVVICPSCEKTDPEVYLMNGMAFCTCGAHVSALDHAVPTDEATGVVENDE